MPASEAALRQVGGKKESKQIFSIGLVGKTTLQPLHDDFYHKSHCCDYSEPAVLTTISIEIAVVLRTLAATLRNNVESLHVYRPCHGDSYYCHRLHGWHYDVHLCCWNVKVVRGPVWQYLHESACRRICLSFLLPWPTVLALTATGSTTRPRLSLTSLLFVIVFFLR